MAGGIIHAVAGGPVGLFLGWMEAAFFGGEAGQVGGEFGVFSLEQAGQSTAEVVPPAPSAHVVLPASPEALALARHGWFVDKDVRALEEGGEDLEEHLFAFELFGGEAGLVCFGVG